MEKRHRQIRRKTTSSITKTRARKFYRYRQNKRRRKTAAEKVPYHRFKRSTYWSETQAKFVTFRSSYEKTYAEYLDANKIKWMYEAKKFMLGGKKYYLPDFYLPDTEKYVEVKGKWYKKSKDKFAVFKELYPDVAIEIAGTEEIMFIRKYLKSND